MPPIGIHLKGRRLILAYYLHSPDYYLMTAVHFALAYKATVVARDKATFPKQQRRER
jgi:hypothetical protein